MHETVRRVSEALRVAGVEPDILELPAAVPTAASAAAQVGTEVGAIANSLLFSVDDQPILLITSGAHRVDTRKVADLLGVGRKKIRRADPDFVLAVTGQRVGGVAPAGHPAPIPAYVDVWLDRYPQVWAGAGQPEALFRTSFAGLLQITGGQAADIGEDS
jgi:prolyl-tRNA editing enzyme YbaK/EbsC (Cys-tRNA(Pro) deacylase)